MESSLTKQGPLTRVWERIAIAAREGGGEWGFNKTSYLSDYVLSHFKTENIRKTNSNIHKNRPGSMGKAKGFIPWSFTSSVDAKPFSFELYTVACTY